MIESVTISVDKESAKIMGAQRLHAALKTALSQDEPRRLGGSWIVRACPHNKGRHFDAFAVGSSTRTLDPNVVISVLQSALAKAGISVLAIEVSPLVAYQKG